MMQFLFPQEAQALWVLTGTSLLGAIAAIVGCFTYLRKRALVGDAVAHAILPGVCLGYLLAGEKDPAVLLIGAVAAGWLSLLAMDLITRNSKLKTDAAIGIVLSVFFGAGVLLMSYIQEQGGGDQSGLDTFIFGKAAAMTRADIRLIAWAGLAMLLIILLFYKEFKLMSFDPAFAESIGLPKRWLEFLLSTVTVLAVAIGIQAVGVVLMAALLITPASTARFWTHRLSLMLVLAALVGALSAWLGTGISLAVSNMPTGPWIVIVLSLFALLSVALAPKKGLLPRLWQQRRIHRKMLQENLLKVFYSRGEKSDTPVKVQLSTEQIRATREFTEEELLRGLRWLHRRHLVLRRNGHWQLTEEGFEEGKRIVRLHRLWELYLNQRLRLAPDHVHHDAEAIEHIITPELEALLQQELGQPTLDPHDSKIPK